MLAVQLFDDAVDPSEFEIDFDEPEGSSEDVDVVDMAEESS